MTAIAPGERKGTSRRRAGLLLAVAVIVPACAAGHPEQDGRAGSAESRMAREWDRAGDAPPEFRARLAASPIAFFRFVNQTWTHAVCDAFAGDASDLPTARLHGDAHVEQYAVTATARGLDDFDDSARGPAVVDVVRFLGSLELAAQQRGWLASLPAAVDAFFAGYRRALEEPTYLPPEPALVRRLRVAAVKTPGDFLAWADSLMQPVTSGELAQLDISWKGVESFAVGADPQFTPAFLTRKKVGWLQMGIGSALTRKLLIHIEGPSPVPDDDLVLEAKEVIAFERNSCVSIPRSSEPFRVVEGLRQIGRFDHRLVVAMPGLTGTRPDGVGWWVRGWDRSYRELQVADLESPEDLGEIAHDVGAQLGATNLFDPAGPYTNETRITERLAMVRLESRIRQVAHELTVELIRAWEHGRVQ